MSNKKWVSLIMLLVLAVFLGACGSPKDHFMQAQANLKKANTFSFNATVKLHVDGMPSNTPQQQQVEKIMNHFQIKINGFTDKKQKKTQMTAHIIGKLGMVNIDAAIPLLIDQKKQKIYVDIDALRQNLAGLVPPGSLPNKKYIEMDMKSVKTSDSQSFKAYIKKLEGSLMKGLGKKAFQEKKDEISLTISGKKFKDLIASVFDYEVKHGLYNGVDPNKVKQALNQLTFDPLKIKAKIQNKTVKTEDLNLGVKENNGVHVKISAHMVYSKINQDVHFTMKPTKENTYKTNLNNLNKTAL